MNKQCYISKILKNAKKLKAINFLGGKCKYCGEDDFFKLVFHHIDPNQKEFEISRIIDNGWYRIEKEIKKCELVCYNCHQELHYGEQRNKRCKNNKKILLEIKNVDGCELCGYNKSDVSLSFHHIGEKKNVFSDFTYEFKSIYDVENSIMEELNTCQVLCINCHTKLHSDVEFFELHKDEIIEKSLNLKSQYHQSKLDRELIKKMYFDDKMKQVDIAKYFNASHGTISDIIKELKLL